ncbi:DnaJ (Hsp40), sub C, member 17 [Apophysomyces sp. BC1034]|nr:DnaJ (Hsp40), sub C, member 17 [Apophysomyces sp. BC1015]KAG0176478.1 DnaJ (Hsp40), sub C, member 17 [Apophysomyces sp. BC1021]KAG0191560.1 DnaJ (Hsp40), sub C, member 17 [Apophysomyces sp. BC1034]
MAKKATDSDVDYYELLGIEITSTTKEITKAYRKKALSVHPDKNPSPDAAALFHALSEAHELLRNEQSRAVYDRLYKARLDRKKKQYEMDSKRRKAQEDLEARESQAKKAKMDEKQAEAQFQAELARLRAEGAKRRQEDWKEETPNAPEEEIPETTELDCSLKLKWKRKKHALTPDDLQTLLNPIGKVDTVVMTEKKGNALVVFTSIVGAHAVMTQKDTNSELGLFESIDWATGKEPAVIGKLNDELKMKREAKTAFFNSGARPAVSNGKPLFSSGVKKSLFSHIQLPPAKTSFSNAPNLSDSDYEAITLMKMRQAERDRLLQQIKEEEKQQL